MDCNAVLGGFVFEAKQGVGRDESEEICNPDFKLKDERNLLQGCM